MVPQPRFELGTPDFEPSDYTSLPIGAKSKLVSPLGNGVELIPQMIVTKLGCNSSFKRHIIIRRFKCCVYVFGLLSSHPILSTIPTIPVDIYFVPSKDTVSSFRFAYFSLSKKRPSIVATITSRQMECLCMILYLWWRRRELHPSPVDIQDASSRISIVSLLQHY